jgi:hypothetical protein
MIDNKRIIVSLTSFPAAIPFAVRAVASILEQSVLPDKVVLYLTASQFPGGEIPYELEKLKNGVFEIRFYGENIRSYTKLIPALKDFPDDIIITADDDVSYGRNMLRGLLRLRKRYPDAVIAHRAKRLKLDAPYREWKKYRWYHVFMADYRPKFGNFQTGIAGVLYPPACLKAEMLDPKIFAEIAPTSDDVWFWAAAVANGTKIAPVPFGQCKPRQLGKPDTISLRSINAGQGADINREALERILEKYPVIKERVEAEA